MTSNRVVVYARVSTEEQARGENTSVDAQIWQCEQYCKAMGWQHVATVRDDGVSGATMNRPGWNRIVWLIESKQTDTVISTGMDRMTRNLKDWLEFEEKVITPHGVRIVWLREQIDTSTPHGRTMRNILLSIYQGERERYAEKIKEGIKAKQQQGLWLNRPPYGAMRGDTRGVPVIDPATWPVVQQVFQLAATGMAYKQIASKLNSMHTPSSQGGQWSYTSVQAIVSNLFYIGERHMGDEVVVMKHACLIDRELWHAAQRAPHPRLGRKPADYPYLLRGKVFTSHLEVVHPVHLAGTDLPLRPHYSFGRDGVKYYYYRRADKMKALAGLETRPRDTDATDFPNGINAEELDSVVLEDLIKIADNARAGTFIARTDKLAGTVITRIRTERQQLAKRLTAVCRSLAELDTKAVNSILAGSVNVIRALDLKMGELHNEREELIAKLAGIDAAIERLERSSEDAKHFVAQVHVVKELFARKAWPELIELIDAMIERIDVRRDELIIRYRGLELVREALSVCGMSGMVEVRGFEPLALRMRTVRSTS